MLRVRGYVPGAPSVLIGLIAPAPGRDLARETLAPEPSLAYAAPLQLLIDRPRGRGRVAYDAGIDAVECASNLLVEVYLHDPSGGREEPAVARSPVVQRRPEREHEVGPHEQLDGERRGETAGDTQVIRSAGEEPVSHRARRQERPYPIPQGFQRLWRPSEGGAQPGQDHRPARPFEQIHDLTNRVLRRAWRLQSRPFRDVWRAGGRLYDVDRDVEHHGAALDPRPP